MVPSSAATVNSETELKVTDIVASILRFHIRFLILLGSLTENATPIRATSRCLNLPVEEASHNKDGNMTNEEQKELKLTGRNAFDFKTGAENRIIAVGWFGNRRPTTVRLRILVSNPNHLCEDGCQAVKSDRRYHTKHSTPLQMPGNCISITANWYIEHLLDGFEQMDLLTFTCQVSESLCFVHETITTTRGLSREPTANSALPSTSRLKRRLKTYHSTWQWIKLTTDQKSVKPDEDADNVPN
ncbi:hypothetical protein T08_10436 [Trichinella sp. T8]|nr:hypothetical protein T08_10436 [Trichinella sp. T8]